MRPPIQSSVSLSPSLSPLCPPPVLLSCDGLILQAGGDSSTTPPTPHTHTHTPLTHPGCSFTICPQPCPALPCLFQPRGLWPQSQKSQFHAHALAHTRKKAANLVHVCVRVFIYVCQFNSPRIQTDPPSQVGLGLGHTGQSSEGVSEHPWGKISSSHSAACPLLISWREGSG